MPTLRFARGDVKPVPRIMTALGLPGYPVPARSTIAPYPIAERCESSGRSETEADAELRLVPLKVRQVERAGNSNRPSADLKVERSRKPVVVRERRKHRRT